jgi:hypothetical protein
MSNVGDALSGSGSSATGVTDTTFSDASLGDQIMGGSGDSFGGSSSGGPNSFSDVVNALSGGGVAGASPIPTVNPSLTQAASMSPPGAASATGGDPTGAASGTQSATSPGSTPPSQNQPQQGGQNQNQPQDHAPPSAVDELRQLLKGLAGKPTGPTGQIPTPPPRPLTLPGMAAGQTGRPSFSPQMIGGMPNEGGIANLPSLAAGETGPPSGQVEGGPSPASQVAGAPPAEARIPPGAPTQPSATVTPPAAPPQGRDITVKKAAPQAMPFPQNEPGEVAPGGPALPTRKPTQPPETPAPAPQAAPQAAPRLLQDISGASLGSPTALADLAQAAQIILPLVAGLMGGGGRRGGHRPGFQGMRGFRPFGARGGFHPTRGGHAWPYHHPQFGWHMHPFHPGPGWLPLNPQDAQSIVGGQQGGQPQDPNAPDPNRPPKETGGPLVPPDKTPTSGAIPGVGAKEVDDYTRQAAQRYNIDPDVASKFLGTESSYGQARRPGDSGTSFGPFQLHLAPDGKAMGNDFMRDTGLDPRDPTTWKAQVDYAMKRAAIDGWSPGWTTTMNKLGLNQWSGINNRRFAGQMPKASHTQPSNVVKAASIPTTLPPSSQPMVAGP